jgi:hypothetical protein
MGNEIGNMTDHPELRKDCAVQALVLGKSLVERHQLKRRRSCKGGKVGVTPEIGRKSSTLRVFPPVHVQVFWLMRERNSGIVQNRVISAPSLLERHDVRLEHCRIGGQPQKPLLRPSAKRAGFVRSFVPRLGGRVMHVEIESQRQPHINVGEKHLLRPESVQSAGPSGAKCLDVWNEPGETRLAFFCRALAEPAQCRSRQSPSCLRATTVGLPEPQRHYVLDRESPLPHCLLHWLQNQG